MTSFSRSDAAATAAIALGALMFGLEISSVPVALPVVGDALTGSVTALQWMVTAYTIASVTVLIAAGIVADRVGRRRVLTAALVTFGLASLVCGIAPGLGVLVAARAAQGLAGGAVMICGLALLSHRFPDGHARARAFGLWGVGLGAGLGLGPAVGSGLIAVAGWRGVFLVHVPLAVVAVIMSRSLSESRDPAPGRLDGAGIVATAVGLVAAVAFISQVPVLGIGSAFCLAALAVALVAIVVLVRVERRAADPMIPGSFFRSRRFTGALLGAIGMNVSFWPLIVYVPLYLQDGLDYGTTAASGVLLAFTLPTFVLPPLAERLSLRWGPQRMIPAALAVIALGLVLLYVAVSSPSATWAALLPGAIVAGVGLGLANTPVTNTTTGSVPAERAGAASGVDLSARFTTLSVSIAVMGALFDSAAPTAGFGRAVLYGAVAVMLLAVTSGVLFRDAELTRV